MSEFLHDDADADNEAEDWAMTIPTFSWNTAELKMLYRYNFVINQTKQLNFLCLWHTQLVKCNIKVGHNYRWHVGNNVTLCHQLNSPRV